jgi:hyaluronan synthase
MIACRADGRSPRFAIPAAAGSVERAATTAPPRDPKQFPANASARRMDSAAGMCPEAGGESMSEGSIGGFRVSQLPEAARPRAQQWFDTFLYALVVAGLLAATLYNLHVTLPRFSRILEHHRGLRLIVYPSLLWVAMGTLLLVFRTVVWMFYRPFAAVSAETAPRLTVVIPAYNEGAMVLRSIGSVAESLYPKDRLEILVVDDGSKDDTWQYICAARDRYPELVTALRHERNLGKRAALALGFSQARGEIIVTLDSDSVIDPDALLNLAGPFRDPKVGAVAGKVLVYNRKGIIPRMLHVRYVLSFDLLRCVESAYGNVFCCPGALTALRASAIRPLIGRWKAQRFLGSTCTIGEDRAMTNYLLDAGYNTVYQGSAVVRTIVPTDYRKLCKMLLRWDRSYVREELRFARIVWKRPLLTRFIALYDRVVTNLRFPLYYGSLALLIPLATAYDPWAVGRMLAAIGFMSLCNMLYFLRSERSFEFLWGVAYSYFAIVGLSWIFPYAVVTVRSRGWLTR